MSQGLLTVTMLAHSHRLRGNDGVIVVRGRDRDGIDAIAQLIEHLAVVGEGVIDLVNFGVGLEIPGIGVAQRKNLAILGCMASVASSFAVNTYAGNLQLLIGRRAGVCGRPARRTLLLQILSDSDCSVARCRCPLPVDCPHRKRRTGLRLAQRHPAIAWVHSDHKDPYHEVFPIHCLFGC